MIVHLDYETTSLADLEEVGAHRYSVDPGFEILMAAVSAEGDDRVLLWVNPRYGDTSENAEAEALLARATEIYAHNAPFEQACSWGAATRCKERPLRSDPPLSAWRCTAAMARKAGLPSSLDKLGTTLGLTDAAKDKRGKSLIQLFSIQRASPKDHPEEWRAFCDYCRQDVRAEKACHAKLKAFELSGAALATFQFDLRMNQRGIPINVTAARNAQKIIEQEQAGVTEEFRRLTGLNPTQREKVRELVNLPNMQGPTVETALADPLISDETRRILQLYQAVSFSAVKKIRTMLDCVCPDGRVRGAHLYYGAGTGRWSSRLLQVQNFRKPDPAFKKLTDSIYADIAAGHPAHRLDLLYGPPLECIANCIRNFIHPPTGVLDGDYNAIEGRIGCWDAGQHDILECWRKGEDLYKRAAGYVFGIPESSVLNPSPERDFGKVVELACQFGLGVDGFRRTCKNFGIECDVARAHKAVHEYYRPTHQAIVSKWYIMDDQMRSAIGAPGVECGPFVVRRIAGIPFLLQRLPSGRSLAYPRPEINPRKPTEKERLEMEGGKKYPPNRFLEVTYWGPLPGTVVWGRPKLHGALVFENRVQAIAADFMAHGAITAEARGMAPFMLVHDQGLAEPNGHTAAEYAAALGDLPAWGRGFPMRVEAHFARFYKK